MARHNIDPAHWQTIDYEWDAKTSLTSIHIWQVASESNQNCRIKYDGS